MPIDIDATLAKLDTIAAKLAKMEARVKTEERRKVREDEEAPPTHEELAKITATEDRADAILQMYGERAPRPLSHEHATPYRLRTLAAMRKHSDLHGDMNLADRALRGSVLDAIENEIYENARTKAQTGLVNEGRLVPVTTKDQWGRLHTKYYGSTKVAFAPFMIEPRRMIINRPGKAR